MRRSRESVLGGSGEAHCYHVVSRVVGRELVFGDAEREYFKGLLDRQLRFSGLRLLAWCCMGNHFHLLLEVPDKEAALEGWAEEDFIGRLGVLSSEGYTRKVLNEVRMWRGNGNHDGVAKAAGAVRERLFDLSRFMQELKFKFSAWFNKRHGRKGTLWEERFKSVLVEGVGGMCADGPGGLLAVAAYIDLNPVRAGIVDDPKDYRWCSYGEAVAGDKAAREGLARCATGKGDAGWRKAAKDYRLALFGAGEEVLAGESADGVTAGRRGFTKEEIEAEFTRGGKLPLPVLLRCRVRYFTDGVALGGNAFLARIFGSGKGGENPEDRRRRGSEPVRGASRLRIGCRMKRPALAAPG